VLGGLTLKPIKNTKIFYENKKHCKSQKLREYLTGLECKQKEEQAAANKDG
jgi:hypothetical protein